MNDENCLKYKKHSSDTFL